MLLALDCATTTGWAHGAPGCNPAHGTFGLPNTNDDVGRFHWLFAKWLSGKLVELNPKFVAIEKAFIVPGRDDYNTVLKLTGLVVVAMMICTDRGVAYEPYSVSTWRSGFLGPDYAKIKARHKTEQLTEDERRQDWKREVCKQARALGWSPRNDDEGDALGLLSYVQSLNPAPYARRCA